MKIICALLFAFTALMPQGAIAQGNDVDAIMKAVSAKWDSLQNYQCMMRSRNRVGDQKDEKKYQFSFKKPHQVLMEVTEGSEAGSKLLRTTDRKNYGKKGGLLKLVPFIELKEDDPRLQSLRGRKFYLADWGTVIKEYREYNQAGMKFSMGPNEKYNSVDCAVIIVEVKPQKLGVTRDMLLIDKANSIILCRRQFEGNTLVNEAAWWNVQIDTNMGDEVFAR